jgi:ubiquinone/menaquinone biosynthesis C-methylase UbiE
VSPFLKQEVRLQRIDYDVEQHQNYARGRVLAADQVQVWLDAFAAVLPARRPLVGLDVGSGTGRYTPALGRAFGPATGVEPSVRMREVAQAQALAPRVRYLAGSAEALPVASESADYALLSCCWHHVQDKPQAVHELARVLRPGGLVLLRTNFRDHHPRPWWLEHFPRGYQADAAMFQPLHEVIALFTSSGWRVTSFTTVTEPSSGTRADMLTRLRLRTLSFFAQLDQQELDVGFRRLEQAVAADPDAPAPVYSEPLLALQRPGSS